VIRVEHTGKIVTRYLSGKWAQHYPRDLRSPNEVLHDPSQFGIYRLGPIARASRDKQKIPPSAPEQRADARRLLGPSAERRSTLTQGDRSIMTNDPLFRSHPHASIF
jgi:hypothetical protein